MLTKIATKICISLEDDVDRVARYFMRGGAIAGHPILGSPQCDTDNVVGAPNPQIQKQPETPRLEMMVGAPSPCQSSEPQLSSSPSYEAYYQMPDSIVGAPMLSTPYNNMPHLLYKPSRVAPFLQRSVVLPHLSAGAQLRLNPYYSRFHYPLLSHLRHPLLRAPYLGDSAVNIVGAVPENYASPDQMLAERPETLAAAPPIVQPGYVHSSTPRVEVPMSNDMTMFLHEILMHQNAILEAIQQRLHKAGENVGASRMLSASMEPNLGAPPPKPPNCHCPGQNKHQMPMVGAPRKPDCKQRAPRMSPAMETLVEGIDKIENIENNENIENIANMGNIEQQQLEKMAIVENEQMANNEAFKTEVTTEKPQKEARSIANGRKRKRELKKILESKAA
uniref:PDCD2_0 protein n=1 Tax=Fopius arisanus TaxID=64838 RepID=A0A0C9QRD5_9HYME